jgi:hypothetical protein
MPRTAQNPTGPENFLPIFTAMQQPQSAHNFSLLGWESVFVHCKEQKIPHKRNLVFTSWQHICKL